MDKEKEIIDSWKVNAPHWIKLIESNGIESRKLVTNQAILDKIISAKPAAALDLGCGEGWLTAQLFESGIAVTAVDAIPELINKAKEKSAADFYIASYEDVALHKIDFRKSFDAIVINFALIGKDSTESLLGSLPAYLAESGKLFIQTLHPAVRKEINDYVTGWKKGSWDGLGEEFTLPYEWYFRTTEDWTELLQKSGFSRVEISETRHPQSGKLLSILFECGK
jgi:2-polyprenyl-3-methyl-5-hydroxy-6-metoxy-1,4-benzoquinol methylase